jgi:hypothetical protein
MHARVRGLWISLAYVALLATSRSDTATAQSVTREETVRSVQRMLERLPYYGVFDYIVFRVDRGVVYLAGYSFVGLLMLAA